MRKPFVLPVALLMAGGLALGAVAAPDKTPAKAPATAAQSTLTVSGAYVPEGPPTAKVLAAYLTLTNPSARAEHLIGATSPDFGKVEVHRTYRQDGVARMSKAEQVLIPAKGKTAFEPGGYHFMLFRPQRALKVGDTVSLQLQFRGAGTMTVTVPVTKRGGPAHEHGHHGHH